VQTPENTEETPDYARGLFVCEKIGHEFASLGSTGTLVSLISSQGFAMLFMSPVVVYFALLNLVGASAWVAGIGAGVTGVAVTLVGIIMLRRVNLSNHKGGAFFRNESDSRYRVRAVIPRKRRTERLIRWVEAAVHAELVEDEPVQQADLEQVPGGFEPIIVRPWFGVNRGKAFWWTAIVGGIVCTAGLLQFISLLIGGWGMILDSAGLMGYAIMGAAMVSGLVCAELIWPVYVRLVPGRLDLFRYGFLGSGTPTVETHDLKRQGVCVDFGSYTIAVEPERAIGEPLPRLVQAKKWPHGQTLPEGHVPCYVCLALVKGRREIAQRVIQAARTDESTPVVSGLELGG